MNPNFAEQAKAWRHKQTMTAGEDYIANLAFLAGCEHGYRVGKAERNCSVELTCEGGIFECQKEQIEKERDQLKAGIEVMERIANHRAESIDKMLAAIRTFLPLFDEYGKTGKTPHGYYEAWSELSKYAKHPQDGAKGDL